jgi:hypothetical protein
MNVIFITPNEFAHIADNTSVYIGDMRQRDLFPDDAFPVQYFVSFTSMTGACARASATLAPLLLLGETRSIRIQTSLHANAVVITADDILTDIEERIDDVLHKTIPEGVCVYRTILGPEVTISAHVCSDHQ